MSLARVWLAIGLPALLLSAYCTPDPDPSASPADAGASTGAGGFGHDAGGSTTKTTSTPTTTPPSSTTSAGGSSCAGDLPRPDVVPEGWVPWRDWSCECPFWVPTKPEDMPAPFQWQPCSADGPTGVECEELVLDYAFGDELGMGISRMGTDADGKPVIATQRAGSKGTQTFIAEPDGKVLFAMMRDTVYWGGCRAVVSGVDHGRFGIKLRGDGTTPDGDTSDVDGLLYGDLGDLRPHVAPLRDDGAPVWGWTMGAGFWVNSMSKSPVQAVAIAEDFSTSFALWPPAGGDPDGLPLVTGGYSPVVVGRDILFSVGTLAMAGVMAYDDQRGVHPLIRTYGDPNLGAAGLGTDGKDMVWTLGEGHAPGVLGFVKRSVWTAPYTTDPSALKPRRLRSDPAMDLGVNEFVVGCGYATHADPDAQNTLLVRLSDGVAWTLRTASSEFAWGPQLGITCTNAYYYIYDRGAFSLARVKLSSLGPGLPPD